MYSSMRAFNCESRSCRFLMNISAPYWTGRRTTGVIPITKNVSTMNIILVYRFRIRCKRTARSLHLWGIFHDCDCSTASRERLYHMIPGTQTEIQIPFTLEQILYSSSTSMTKWENPAICLREFVLGVNAKRNTSKYERKSYCILFQGLAMWFLNVFLSHPASLTSSSFRLVSNYPTSHRSDTTLYSISV